MNKILLPVEVPEARVNAIRQAAFLARHFSFRGHTAARGRADGLSGRHTGDLI